MHSITWGNVKRPIFKDKHPVKAIGGSRCAIHVFEAVAAGDPSPTAPPSILQWLLDNDLIRRHGVKPVYSPAGWNRIPNYLASPHARAQWCVWCSELIGKEAV